MKKFAVIAVALCVAVMMAVPAGALEITTDGYYRARWLAAYNAKMTDDDNIDNASNSYGDMRLRVNNVLKVNDNLSIRTRFRALNDTMWGGPDDGKNNFDWERAWLVARMNFGLVEVGRMQGGTWGTAFADTEVEADRIKLTMPIGPVTLLAIYQKSAERDGSNSAALNNGGFVTEDSDIDTFYPAVVWKHENMSAGLLGAYTDNASRSDLASPNGYWASTYALLPFFTGKFGPFGIQAEANWGFGDAAEWVDDVPGRGDRDKDSLAYNVEGTFDFGMGVAQLGYAFASGQERGSSGTLATEWEKDSTAGSVGADWIKMLILTGDTGPQVGVLGGYSAWGDGGNRDGIQLIYAGVDFQPMENLTIGFVGGLGTADETDRGQDDDLGWEVDGKVAYSIFDNLTNTFQVGYLDGGDYFLGSENAAGYARRDQEFESDVWVFQNELKLAF
jgi:hypothetical protein